MKVDHTTLKKKSLQSMVDPGSNNIFKLRGQAQLFDDLHRLMVKTWWPIRDALIELHWRCLALIGIAGPWLALVWPDWPKGTQVGTTKYVLFSSNSTSKKDSVKSYLRQNIQRCLQSEICACSLSVVCKFAHHLFPNKKYTENKHDLLMFPLCLTHVPQLMQYSDTVTANWIDQ